MSEVWQVHGLSLSYFTGKIEAYLRAKGVPYRLIEMTAADLRLCASATGVSWMPQIETPAGWLTDTPRIIEYLEHALPDPAITPADPAAAFIAGLIEDFGDEQLWRPALYYRWAHAPDQRLRGEQIARAMLSDLPLPLWIKSLIVISRQKRVYLAGDGVTPANRQAVEAEYLSVLDALEPALASRDFVMGDRPTEADFGLFGGLFRHFAQDPTPAAIMASRAPAVLAWTQRLWALDPEQFRSAIQPSGAPAGLDGLARSIIERFLPMLMAHEAAWNEGRAETRFRQFDADFTTAVSPYRVWRFQRMRERFWHLEERAKVALTAWLADRDVRSLLETPIMRPAPAPIPLPITAGTGRRLDSRPRDRQWRRV
jgi:glutathione S-transferase